MNLLVVLSHYSSNESSFFSVDNILLLQSSISCFPHWGSRTRGVWLKGDYGRVPRGVPIDRFCNCIRNRTFACVACMLRHCRRLWSRACDCESRSSGFRPRESLVRRPMAIFGLQILRISLSPLLTSMLFDAIAFASLRWLCALRYFRADHLNNAKPHANPKPISV